MAYPCSSPFCAFWSWKVTWGQNTRLDHDSCYPDTTAPAEPRPDLLTTLATFSKRKSHNICVQDGDKLIMNSEGPNMRSAALSSVYLQVQNHDRRSSWPTFYLQILAASIMTGLQYLFVQLMEDKGRNLLENSYIWWNYTSRVKRICSIYLDFFPPKLSTIFAERHFCTILFKGLRFVSLYVQPS